MQIRRYMYRYLYNREIEYNIQIISKKQAENIIRQCKNVKLIDVRSPQEYAEGHKEKAILIPSYEIQEKAQRILKDKNEMIILYCTTGIRAKKTAVILERMGYRSLYVLE